MVDSPPVEKPIQSSPALKVNGSLPRSAPKIKVKEPKKKEENGSIETRMNKSYEFVYQDKLKEGRLAESLVTRSTLIKENRPSIFVLESSKKVSQVEPFRWFAVGKPTDSVAHKTILLVGATGSGKSTLVDAMVNYILGVKWDDPFRFQVVPDEKQCGTRCVTSYTIHHTEGMTIPYTLTIIDTPGFGDEGTMKTICEFFVHSETKIDYINAICFVASSVDRKLSPTQTYVISSVLSIFGKEIRDNIRLLATFTDGSFPPVVEACVAAGFPLKTDIARVIAIR